MLVTDRLCVLILTGEGLIKFAGTCAFWIFQAERAWNRPAGCDETRDAPKSTFYQRLAAAGIWARSRRRIAFFWQAGRQIPQP